MRVGVIQSCYIPWRGYFDFIASVDLFVFHDDLQYTKADWRNRNRIKTENGVQWLTVPVHHKASGQLICDTAIDHANPWGQRHIRKLAASYRRAPHLDQALDILSVIEGCRHATISELNVELTKRICRYLDIATPMLRSEELSPSGRKTERLIGLLKQVKATGYLSGPSADAYLDKDAFRANGIRLEYKSYDYGPYPQLWGGFDGAVTVLDLIANCGRDAIRHLRSRSPDRLVVG